MGFHVQSLSFVDFRNYEQFDLKDIDKLTIFVGPNAVGKSNIIEGLQLMSSLTSFKHATAAQLIRWGARQARVETKLVDGSRELDLNLFVDDEGKHYQLNDKNKRVQDLQGQLPAVVFTPDDLFIVKGSPSIKRDALDAIGVQLSSSYRSVKRDYEKIVHQKNQLLKNEVVPGYLDSINDVLVRVGSQLYLYRLKIVSEMQKIFPYQYRMITGTAEQAQLMYQPSWNEMEDIDFSEDASADGFSLIKKNLLSRDEIEKMFFEALDERKTEELKRHRSLVGPHKDRPGFAINKRDASFFASQGQQRSLAICFKLTELSLIEEIKQQQPLLLLDDVMSELDSSRRKTLVEFVDNSIQTFITTTNLDYFTPEIINSSRIIELPLS